MAVRGDEIVERLEQQLRETITRLSEEIRSSVQDVRVAVDQQLDAAMQSVQADVNSFSFKSALTAAVREMEEGAEAPPAAVPPATPDSQALRRAVKTCERGRSQVDVLNALLDEAAALGSRAALFILKGDTFSGWKGVGFSAHGGHDEAVKRFSAAPGAIAEFDTLLREERVISFDGIAIAARLGGAPPAQALLVPMVIKDKISAAVYVDVVDDQPLDQAGLELLVFTTGLLVDTLAIRKKIPSPTLSGETGDETRVAPPPAAAPLTAAPEVAPRPAVPQPPAATVAVPLPPPPAPTPRGFAPEAVPAVESPPPPPIRTTQVEPPPAPPVAPPPLATPSKPIASPGAPGGGEPAERPSTQYVPPPGLSRTGPFSSAPPNEDARKHDEARRFARLLISEIKLYNEAKVEQGRKNRDLYDRLKEDIDRSRQMYDERIPEEVRKSSNYFYDELVRILADNNTEALGL